MDSNYDDTAEESTQTNAETTEGSIDEYTVDDFDTAESLAWIVSRHARKTRDAMAMHAHAEKLFDLSARLRDELPGDRDDVSVTLVEEEINRLYESVQYTYEQGPDGEITENDVTIATLVYEDLGGDVQDEEDDEWEPEPATLRDGETRDDDAHASRNSELVESGRQAMEKLEEAGQ